MYVTSFTVRIQLYLILSTITMFHFFIPLKNISASKSKELYVNPWKDINRTQPKIIKFLSNGEVKEEYVPLRNFVSLKKLMANFIQKFRETHFFRKDESLNTTHVMDVIRNHMNEMYATLRPLKKLKILTECTKDRSVCRFLACPNIRDHCVVCEVKMKNPTNNSTTCEKYSTKFLTSLKHFRNVTFLED